MGYTTEFDGHFELEQPLTSDQARFLLLFAETRRMKRDPNVLPRKKLLCEEVGIPLGDEGEHYVEAGGLYGQERDKSTVEYNYPPSTQPGLWCQWVPGHWDDPAQLAPEPLSREEEDGVQCKYIIWDRGDKFYDYVEWLRYIIKNFLVPWGHVLNGEMLWQGEELRDRGRIVVSANDVSVHPERWQ